MTFDPSSDFGDIVDGLEAVTLSVSGIDDQAIVRAHRNQVTNQQVEASNGQTRQGDTIWQWAISETPTRPILGSTITDGDSEVWTILQIAEQVLASKWSATCRDLAVEANLDTLITIQQATYAKSDAGAAVPTWADVYTDVRARVQPVDQLPELDHDRDETERRYRVILASDLAISTVGADWRVVDADGDIYAIEKYERAERIDTLPALDVLFISESSSSSSGS